MMEFKVLNQTPSKEGERFTVEVNRTTAAFLFARFPLCGYQEAIKNHLEQCKNTGSYPFDN